MGDSGNMGHDATGAQIKICGLFRDEDIDAVNAARPDWAGFIIDVPFSHRSISPTRAKKLISNLSAGIQPVGVFFDSEPEDIVNAVQEAGFSAVQLHGSETDEVIRQIREMLEERSLVCGIWKAFKVEDESSIARARKSTADIVLLDGGTGEGHAFNWQLCAEMERPFIVAGGLDPGNIPDALRSTGAFACDLSSGVETDKLKDPKKINDAVEAARSIK